MGKSGWDTDPVDVDRDGILVEAEYDWSETVPSIAVVEAIASVEGLGPAALSRNGGFTLNEYVDAEALDRLVADGRATEFSIGLTVSDYAVRIEGSAVTVADISIDPGSGSDLDLDPDSDPGPGPDRE